MAFRRFSRDENAVRERARIGDIETQISHPVLRVWPVTGETIIGKNRPDLTIEIDGRECSLKSEEQQYQNCTHGIPQISFYSSCVRALTCHSADHNATCKRPAGFACTASIYVS